MALASLPLDHRLRPTAPTPPLKSAGKAEARPTSTGPGPAAGVERTHRNNLALPGTCGLMPRAPCAHCHLVELRDLRRAFLLVHLLLPLEQCVLAVHTAADPLVILLVQDRAHTAHTADAAPAGAVHTVGRLVGTGVGAQGILAGTGELVCQHTGQAAMVPTTSNYPATHRLLWK